MDITKRLVRDEGPQAFYKGLFANLLKGIPQRGIYFYFYELLKQLWVDPHSQHQQWTHNYPFNIHLCLHTQTIM